MEVVRAIIAILVGVMVIFIVAQLALPLLGVFAVIIVLGVVRAWASARRYGSHRSAYEQQRQRDERARRHQSQQQRTSSQSRSQSSRSNNPNVIDAEFTEEEIVE